MSNFSRIFEFALAVGFLSTAFANLCNLNNCYNLTNIELAGQSQYFDPINDSNENYTRIIGFGGLTSNCQVTFTAKTSIGSTRLEIQWIISQSYVEISSQMIGIVESMEYPVDVIDRLRISVDFNKSKLFETQLIPQANRTFLRILVHDAHTKQIIRDENLNYVKTFDLQKRDRAQRMVIGLPVNGNSMIRFLETKHCEGQLTIRLCPCVEPAVSLERQGSNLTCQGGSIDEISELLWLKNDQVVSIDDEPKRGKRYKLLETSTITNVTESKSPTIYTCSVKTGRNRTTKRSITIPAFSDGNNAGDGVGDTVFNKESQEHIAYIIFFVVCAVLVTLVVSTCFVLHLTNMRKSHEDAIQEPEVEVISQEEKPMMPTRTETNDLLYQSLDDLLQLLNSVAYNRPGEQIDERKARLGAGRENIYDRLDPRLMTVNRGGRIESTSRLSDA